MTAHAHPIAEDSKLSASKPLRLGIGYHISSLSSAMYLLEHPAYPSLLASPCYSLALGCRAPSAYLFTASRTFTYTAAPQKLDIPTLSPRIPPKTTSKLVTPNGIHISFPNPCRNGASLGPPYHAYTANPLLPFLKHCSHLSSAYSSLRHTLPCLDAQVHHLALPWLRDRIATHLVSSVR